MDSVADASPGNADASKNTKYSHLASNIGGIPLRLSLLLGVALLTFGFVSAPASACLVIGEGCGLHEEGVREAWIGVIEDYGPGDTDLEKCGDNGPDIEDELDGNGWVITRTADTATLETVWKSTEAGGTDDANTDARDIAYFCGHGGLTTSASDRNSWVVFNNNVEDEGLFSSESHYGEIDLEWVVWDDSRSLYIDDPNSNQNLIEWFAAFEYLHMMIGWHDSPLDTSGGFQFFDEMVNTGVTDGGGSKVKTAWFAFFGGCWGNNDVYQNILSESTIFADDYLHGEGDGAVDDVNHDSSYIYWGNLC